MMKKIATALLTTGVALGAISVQADTSPEKVRQQFVDYYKTKFPDLKPNDFNLGALALDADSKAQYDAVMDFPPYAGDLDKGKKMWETPFKNGKTYASCFPDGGKNVAGNYPMFDSEKKVVVTFEDAINACRIANGEEAYDYKDAKTMGVLTAYARTLSNGMAMNIKVEGPDAMAAFERGKHYYFQRRGQLNFSCATCHVDNAGHRIRSELLSPAVGQATHWPVFRAGEKLTTLQVRYEGCVKQSRAVPPKPGSKEFNELEYFHSYLSNGLPLEASVFRK